MAVQLQWSLDATVGSALSIGLDVMRAAARSNVQPLAILACEKFGNTIAMCPETCRKVEKAMMTPDPVPIAFLRATVGFFADDAGAQLSRSLAGTQFLGLAAALTSSIGPFKSGLVLELLLKNSTSDRTLLPTARQLAELLGAIEPRCVTCGFSDSVFGWRLFLSGNPLIENINPNVKIIWMESELRLPSDEGIEVLVDGLRQIARIGESSQRVLAIRVTVCAPWVIAFTKWCIGVPPTVTFEDDGRSTMVLESPQSPVFVRILSEDLDAGSFGVCVSNSLNHITNVIRYTNVISNWDQLSPIETYWKYRLRIIRCESGTSHSALAQALPYCIHRVVQSLQFCHKEDRNSFPEPSLSPFPRSKTISALACRIMGIEEPTELNWSVNSIGVADIPIVRLLFEELTTNCTCDSCEPRKKTFTLCLKREFLEHLSCIVAEVLA